MSENGEIYTAGKNFTLPPALTAWTNSTSASEVTLVPKITQKPPNFKRLLVPKRAHLHWAQDQGAAAKAFGRPGQAWRV